jgi:hypothetical protein
MNNQTVAFDRLWRWTDEARMVFRSQGYMNAKKLHIPLLDINPEGKLDREIVDIIDELDIMLRISNIHQDMINSFIEQAEHILDPDRSFRKFSDHTPLKRNYLREDEKVSYEEYESFKVRGNECQERINRHVKDLESLRESAKNTADGVIIFSSFHLSPGRKYQLTATKVLHLLTMKQQQAGVVQAWQAVRQSDETVKQYVLVNHLIP